MPGDVTLPCPLTCRLTFTKRTPPKEHLKTPPKKHLKRQLWLPHPVDANVFLLGAVVFESYSRNASWCLPSLLGPIGRWRPERRRALEHRRRDCGGGRQRAGSGGVYWNLSLHDGAHTSKPRYLETGEFCRRLGKIVSITTPSKSILKKHVCWCLQTYFIARLWTLTLRHSVPPSSVSKCISIG